MNMMREHDLTLAGDREELHRMVQRAQQNNQDAFQVLVKQTEPMVRRLAYSVVGPGLLEDAMQESYLVVFRRLGQLQNTEAFLGWLSRIVLHVCYRLSKKHPVVEELPQGLAQRDHAQKVANTVSLHQALQRLPSGDREILLLFELAELSHAEVAYALSIPVGTARSRLHTARKRLAEQLQPQEMN